MGLIESQLLAALDEDSGLDLSVFPPQDLMQAVRSLSNDPVGAALFIWLAGQPISSAHQMSLEIVKHTSDPGVMAEIVAWLTTGGFVNNSEDRLIWNAFVDRIQDRNAHYGVRAQALYGAMYVSQSSRSLLRHFQGILLEVNLTDDTKFLRHVAKIIGVILAHEPAEDLRQTLVKLFEIDDARDEAAMELGLDAIRVGLDANTPDGASNAFKVALNWFETASAEGDSRPDAELYRQSVSLLISFQAEAYSDMDILSRRVLELERTIFEFTAYTTVTDRPVDSVSWMGSSLRERIHWSILAAQLGTLDLSLHKRVWLKAASVIEQQLLTIYTASQSLLHRTAETGLEIFIKPRIVGALQRDRLYLDYIEQWIDENANSEWMHNASAIRDDIIHAREASIRRTPSDAAVGSPLIAAILERGDIPSEVQENILDRVHQDVLTFMEDNISPIFQEIFQSVVVQLEGNPDYQNPTIRQFFNIVLYYTIHYVFSRHEISVSSIQRLQFLFKRDSENPPLEKDLQRDYHEFLIGSPLKIQSEARDLGGGRVDILFTFKGMHTVAELKRSGHNYSNDKLVDLYGLQTISYQTTSIRLCVLLVLDLFEREGGQPHVREQISIHHKIPKWGTTEYSVVVCRVQAMRLTPSNLH